MKKVLLAASIASALCMANVAQAATGGTITFNGKITDQTCQVKVNGLSETETITLSAVPKSALGSSGDTAGKSAFTLDLSGCTVATAAYGVTAFFPDNAANIDSANKILKNKAATDPAANVGLELLQNIGGTETAVPLGQGSGHVDYKYVTMAIGDVSKTMNYAVQYKATGVAGAGNVQGVAVYELAYN